MTQELWEHVQRGLRGHLGAVRTKRTRQSSDALLTGKLYDDGGNRMSPTWAGKGSRRWRYYVSQAALQGAKSKEGSILRVPAADVEALVAEAVGKLSSDHADSQTDIRNLIDRVVIGRATIQIHLAEAAEAEAGARILTLPWTRPSPYRKREILQGANDAKTYARPLPANARAILIEALRDAHRWLDELLSDSDLILELLALREGKSERSIRMTLSLAFLAPEIVKAAVEGRLPRGLGLKRLVDLPMAWPDQWRELGTPGAHNVRVTNSSQTATLETEICGQRLSTARAANEPRRRSERLSRPTAGTASRGNVLPFCGGGNHLDSRGLPGGAEGIRTDGHRERGEIEHSSLRQSLVPALLSG